MNALEYRGVAKNFGEVEAVKPLDLEIPEGGIFGLLGPNGAGKTTLMRMTLGILLPDAGSVTVLGRPRARVSAASLGYLPEERGLYPKMKVGELLCFFGRLRGLSAAEATRRAAEGLRRMGLQQWEGHRVDELSKGMQQKIQLLVALQHRPEVAILDEPFSGLDPVNVDVFMEVLREALHQGTTVVLSTHQMDQVEKLCHSIALIDRGRVVLKGPVGEVRRRYGSRAVKVEFDGGEGLSAEAFDDLSESTTFLPNEGRFFLKEGADARVLLRRFLDAGARISRFEEAQASMHDLFVKVVKGGVDHAN